MTSPNCVDIRVCFTSVEFATATVLEPQTKSWSRTSGTNQNDCPNLRNRF